MLAKSKARRLFERAARPGEIVTYNISIISRGCPYFCGAIRDKCICDVACNLTPARRRRRSSALFEAPDTVSPPNSFSPLLPLFHPSFRRPLRPAFVPLSDRAPATADLTRIVDDSLANAESPASIEHTHERDYRRRFVQNCKTCYQCRQRGPRSRRNAR